MTGDSRNANPIVKEHYATLAKAERHRFVRVSYFSYFFRFIYLISIPLNLMIDDLNLMIDTAIFCFSKWQLCVHQSVYHRFNVFVIHETNWDIW